MITVITVCKNDREGLERTQQSLVAQGAAPFEWLVIDGASTDGTKEFLDSLPSGAVRYISEADQGIYDAMNKGIRESTGRYCIFMNAGDEFARDTTLQEIAPYLSEGPTIVYGDAVEIHNENESYKAANSARTYWYSMFTHHQAVFYRRTDILGGYDTSFRLAADWALTSRLLRAGAVALYIPTPICRFHRGGASDNPRLRRVADKELWRIYREIHQRSLIIAVVLSLAKRGANLLRLHFPSLYRWIRMSQ